MNYVVTSSPNAARCKCYPQQNAVTDITQLAASICGPDSTETFALVYHFEQIVRRGTGLTGSRMEDMGMPADGALRHIAANERMRRVV